MAGDLALPGRQPLLKAMKEAEVVVVHSTPPCPLRNPEPPVKHLASGLPGGDSSVSFISSYRFLLPLRLLPWHRTYLHREQAHEAIAETHRRERVLRRRCP